jgi:hypothetical protein
VKTIVPKPLRCAMYTRKSTEDSLDLVAEQDRADIARHRAQWIKYRYRVDPSRLVFIDETWTKTDMAPIRGWARAAKGSKPRCHVAAERP